MKIFSLSLLIPMSMFFYLIDIVFIIKKKIDHFLNFHI
jgi:hypothetical protein